MLKGMWIRFCDEHNLRAQTLKSNSSTASMAVRSSIGVPALGMMLKTEGFAASEFGHKESADSIASLRREVAELKKPRKTNGVSVAVVDLGKTANGRPQKRVRKGSKSYGRVKGCCFKFNEPDGCALDDCKFNHVCEKCGCDEHGMSSCSE
jgi:hypothetical protein